MYEWSRVVLKKDQRVLYWLVAGGLSVLFMPYNASHGFDVPQRLELKTQNNSNCVL